MKKYLLTSVISLTLSIALIVHLYKTKDIEWIDAIVETSTKAFGIIPEMVSEKVERKIRDKKLADALQVPMIPEPIAIDSSSNAIPIIDSAIVEKPALVEVKKRVRFNAEVTSESTPPIVRIDSVVTPPIVEPAPVPKRKLFNAGIDKTEVSPSKATSVDQLVYFKAQVNAPQRFGDDQEITFRTSEPVTIGNAVIPERVVFQAKANVFDGRIHFIIKRINNVVVKGENFKEQLPGMPISADVQLDKSYFLSEGFPVVFGVHL